MLYTVSSTGMTLQFHYCCGKLKNIEVSAHPVKEDCGKKHKMGSKACCETKEVKSDKDDFYSLSEYKLIKLAPAIAPKTWSVEKPVFGKTVSSGSVAANAPPPPSTPLFILNRVFRI